MNEESKFTPMNGKVYASTYGDGIADVIFIAKGEPYEYEEDKSIKMVHAHFAICASSEILNPIKLNTRSDELGYNIEHCRPATHDEVDLLKKFIYEQNLVWDIEKEQLVRRETRKGYTPLIGELCYICYYFNIERGFIPILFEDGYAHREAIERGWVFATKHACQLMCNKLNSAIQQVSANNI